MPEGQRRPVTTRPVLLVDAHENSRDGFSHLLQRSGYAVIEADGGEDALSILREQVVSAVVMELVLPGMDGYELARRIRRDPATARIPVLVLTADAAPGSRERAEEAGCSAFRLKPCPPKELLQEIRDVIRAATPPRP